MGRYNFSGLQDKDIFAAYTLAGRADGKIDGVEFAKLLDQRREQVKQEVVMLSQELEKLELCDKITKEDFERMGRVYLTSQSENCSMKQAEEIITTLDLKRKAKPSGPYSKIIESMKTPSYASPKPDEKVETAEEKGQHEEPQGEVEWVHSGTVKLAQLKRKYREVKR